MPPDYSTSAKLAPIVGAVLAGGLARRLGGDKGMRLLGGKPMLDHVLDRLGGQVTHVIINANGDPARFARWGLPVVADAIAGHGGPLVGVLSALEWIRRELPDVTAMVSVPADGPFLPRDLVACLIAARDEAGARLAVAASRGRINPVTALWPVDMAEAMRLTLEEEGLAKAEDWVRRFPLAVASFAEEGVDPLFNVNTEADLGEAERLLAATQ